MALSALQELEARAVVGTYARNPVEFVRGQGTTLWDADGNEYLDFLAGISVAQIGHCHPALVEAVTEQAGRLMHVGNLFYTEPSMRLAGRLSDLALGGKAFFCNSGTEAVECAIKLARRHRPKGDFVVMERGFHGRTMGALSATPQEAKQAPFAPLVPGFKVVPHDDAEALAAAVDGHTAAVLIEPVQGEGGIHPLSDATLAAARTACDEHGAMLIFDEIQCGMGRTGDWWGWQRSGIRPDAMTVAKGLGGGLPIGACLTAPAYADVLQPGDHGSTFAGGPVIAAGANAVLDVISEDGFLGDVAAKGARLSDALVGLGLQPRGRGLMLAFAAGDAPALALRLLTEHRLVVNATGPDTIRLLPPLTVSEEEIDEAAARISASL
ncbi:MAG TPA: aspartate aminotransferase family protein [Thermoleophilaceae bacterium]|nr:aspartate aminotransferase family protein [Thermoleophilaceae bacterium]